MIKNQPPFVRELNDRLADATEQYLAVAEAHGVEHPLAVHDYCTVVARFLVVAIATLPTRHQRQGLCRLAAENLASAVEHEAAAIAAAMSETVQ